MPPVLGACRTRGTAGYVGDCPFVLNLTESCLQHSKDHVAVCLQDPGPMLRKSNISIRGRIKEVYALCVCRTRGLCCAKVTFESQVFL
jgi:hypothetical protein